MGRKGAKKGKGNAQQGGGGNITEAFRVRLSKVLDEFRNSDVQVHTFESGLSKQERASLHVMCRKMGLISKSAGKGDRRCLSIFKTRNKERNQKEEESVECLKFSAAEKSILQDLFAQYPPGDGDSGEESLQDLGDRAGNLKQRPDNSLFCKPKIRKVEIMKKVESFASKLNESSQLKKIAEDRAKLPIASFKDRITSTLETHQVVLISGETGCGKTTQVPQYILDFMWSKGKNCKIICTQPRRISAISVAERISFERGETVGDNIGYKIRLESKGGRHSSILFCTNGILLRLLIGKGETLSKTGARNGSTKDELMGITHIIVDEIHERDKYADFMLAILRDLLPYCPGIRLILMSATMDAERFSRYFSGCPVVQVPGFTYSVKTFYLEDVLSILKSANDNHLDSGASCNSEEDTQLTDEYKHTLDESINLALSSDELDPLLELMATGSTLTVGSYQHSLTGVSPLMVFAGKGRVGDVCMLMSLGIDCDLRDNDGRSALDWAQQENQVEIYEVIYNHVRKDLSRSVKETELLEKYLASTNTELIDTVLIERLLKKICIDSKEGAILVFLPGWDDISQTRERLLASPFFRDQSKFLILPLHSMVPSSEQKNVFKHPPAGIRKIILSTNIAETAVTIDDVVYVIDSGRMKEKNYDPYRNVSTLHSSWVSKASARQREGRAGRCQPGTCYHFYSKIRAASLPEHQVPEIKRMPIEELCLQVKLLDPHCEILEFLQKTLDPPVAETVRNAIGVLHDIGALTEDEKLTDLGAKLGCLPVHPSTSKMLLFAILMNCLEPALTLACAADYRDPFILPIAPDEKKKAHAAKAELASLYGGFSDQLAVIAAFECWRQAKDRGKEKMFCSRYFVSSNTMNMLSGMRKQLNNELKKNGFISEDTASCSLNSHDPGILRAILTANAYPMVGRLLPRRKHHKRALVETAGGDTKVLLHPHSLNFKLSFSKSASSPLVVYDEITRGDTGMYIKNSSLVGPYSLLLIAAEMSVAPANNVDESDEDVKFSSGEEDEMELKTSLSAQGEHIMSSPDNIVSVIADRWLKFESTALDVAQMYCLRERLSSAILFKVKNPDAVLPPALGASMHAIAGILSNHGLSFVPSLDEAIEPNSSDMGNQSRKPQAGNAFTPSSFLRSLMPSDASKKASLHSHNGQSPILHSTSSASLVPNQNVQLPNLPQSMASDGQYPKSYNNPLSHAPILHGTAASANFVPNQHVQLPNLSRAMILEGQYLRSYNKPFSHEQILYRSPSLNFVPNQNAQLLNAPVSDVQHYRSSNKPIKRPREVGLW